MSNIERFQNVKEIVKKVEPDFNELAKIHNAVNYKREASFALQALTANSYLAQMAMNDQDSLKRAIINVAAIGLSLSPVLKLAYLVPRDKMVHLDISYRGYIQLGVEVGAIKWAIAEVVCEKDEYLHQGVDQKPVHKFNPFGERGKIIGAYCVAKTHGDEYLVTVMSAAEIFAIRDRSVSWKSYVKDGKSSPWNTDESEMIKKTVIKRAYKSWPMVDTREKERFERAIDVSNELDPVDFNNAPQLPQAGPQDEDFASMRDKLKILERTEEQYITHLSRANRREIKKLEDLTTTEVTQALSMLNQWIDADKKKKEKEKEPKNEIA